MFPRHSGATPSDLEEAYDTHSRALWEIARELELPDDAAEELITESLLAALVQKTTADPEAWLAATFTAAAKRLRERGA